MVARLLLLEAGALGGVMVDVLAAAPRRRRAAIAAHRIAPHSQASGAKMRAKVAVKAMPQSAPRAHNRPLCNLAAV